MTLIDGIGDEVTHFFLGLLIVIIVIAVTIAWWTTNITEQRHIQTVWLLERRRHLTQRRLTNHTHTVTFVEGGTITRSLTTVGAAMPTPPVAVEAAVTTTTATPAVPKPPEEQGASGDPPFPEERGEGESPEVVEEQNHIVETMDSDANFLRQRRLAFYDSDLSNREDHDLASASTRNDQTYVEKNQAEVPPSEPISATPPDPPPQDQHSVIIKLKYLNDDLRLVDGKLNEPLGDFKKRHFQDELTSNKLVRLIFNGQVLHQDARTLEGCGFFNNCVVHCLIHQQRRPTGGGGEEGLDASASSSSTSTNTNQNFATNNLNSNNNNNNNNNNNQGRDWDLGNVLFASISFTLLSAWYFRYVYAHLYTATATIGLVLLTGIFTIVIFGFYFPDQDHIGAAPRAAAEATRGDR